MSEYMFGLTGNGRIKSSLTKTDINAHKQAAKKHDCVFIWTHLPGEQYPRGWFAGPNRGSPFDERMAENVMAELEASTHD